MLRNNLTSGQVPFVGAPRLIPTGSQLKPSLMAWLVPGCTLIMGAAIRIASLTVRGNCPFHRRRPPFANARPRTESNRIERKTEQLVLVSTPFGRIALGRCESSEHHGPVIKKMQAEHLPESTRSLHQDPIDDSVASL